MAKKFEYLIVLEFYLDLSRPNEVTTLYFREHPAHNYLTHSWVDNKERATVFPHIEGAKSALLRKGIANYATIKQHIITTELVNV